MDSGSASSRSPDFPSPTGARSQPDAEGLGTLVAGIVEDLQKIIRGEMDLAKAEIKEDATSLGVAAGTLIAGAMVALVGFIFLMLGVTYLLNKSLEMWLSAGIVGAALTILGLILVMAGRNKLQSTSLTPTETIDSLKEDQEWASQQIKSVGK